MSTVLVLAAMLAVPFISHFLSLQHSAKGCRGAERGLSYVLLVSGLIACILTLQVRGLTSGVKLLFFMLFVAFGSTFVLIGWSAPDWRHPQGPPDPWLVTHGTTANVVMLVFVLLFAAFHSGALETTATPVSRAMARTLGFAGFYALDPPFEVKRVEVGSCLLDDGVGWPDFARAHVVRCNERHHWQVESKVDESDPCPEADAYDAAVRPVERVIPPNKWCLVEAVSGELTHTVCFSDNALACTE